MPFLFSMVLPNRFFAVKEIVKLREGLVDSSSMRTVCVFTGWGSDSDWLETGAASPRLRHRRLDTLYSHLNIPQPTNNMYSVQYARIGHMYNICIVSS